MNEVLSRTIVDEWCKRFKECKESLNKDERGGRPASSRTDESVEKIRELIRKYHCMSVRLIYRFTCIRKSHVYRILNEDLSYGMRVRDSFYTVWATIKSMSGVFHVQDIVLTADNDSDIF